MRLVFVHGIAQGGKSSEALRSTWTDALTAGYEAGGVDPVPSNVDLAVPFYGDALDAQAARRQHKITSIVTRGEVPEGEVPPLISEIVEGLRERSGVSEAEVRAEIVAEHGPVAHEKGPENWEWVQATARTISTHVPWLTEKVIAQFVTEVDTYLAFPQVVDEIVSASIAGDTPVVVVSHSLGTVVAYNVLTASGAVPTVPLFVTLGSPLAIPSIKKTLGPLGMPAGVGAWLNAADERDVVALFSSLRSPQFAVNGIDNLTDLHNARDHPHGIDGYLGDGRVAERIAATLTG